MNFEVVDHVQNRVQAYSLKNFLDKTAGKAIRLAGDHLKVSKQKSDFAAEQVCIGLQAALSAVSGKRFNSPAAAINFLVGELQYAVKTHLKKHKHHLNGHLLDDDDWTQIETFVAQETIAATHAHFTPPQYR